MSQVHEAILDLALTIDMHPLCFGLVPECSGQVALPVGVSMKYTLVDNIRAWTDEEKVRANAEKTRTLSPGQTGWIYPLMKQLEIRYDGQEQIRVVVIEHRCLKKVLTDNPYALSNVIVVMTAGYPSSATREFLHMLSLDRKLRDSPFLYFADHDLQGFQIFQTLKYGGYKSADANEVMVCSRLEFAGPSKEDLENSPKAYLDHWEAQYTSDHPHMAPADVEVARAKFLKDKSEKIQSKLQKATKKDRELEKALKGSGCLALEPAISKEVDLIFAGAAKFRLADLAQVNMRYVRMFLAAKLNAMSVVTTAEASPQVEAPARRSATAERYKALGSQLRSSPQAPLYPEVPVAEDEALELLDIDAS